MADYDIQTVYNSILPNAAIPDGLACLCRSGVPVWLGPVVQIPDEEFTAAGTTCYVSPATHDRIAQHAAATGKGKPLQ